ncbi:hypothetical protein [Rhabdochromatium marinum]|uniref:hypothetical protein n=1 Tax=Rhabdochromatium marinum TaxID=48729 RepID=UPI001905B47C|nr:hypothetical protein [Rhabdochromatium marinum]MBK1650374.1 hypothetical protein [Rhabdochromatium marinum]
MEKALKLLASQYEAALVESALHSGADRVRAEQEAERIADRMDQLEQAIQEMTLAPAQVDCPSDHREPDKVHDLLNALLHRIDFDHVDDFVRDLLKNQSKDGRAGLLLFQHCSRRSGSLCAKRIISLLKTEAGGLFRPFPVRLEAKNGAHNDADLLLRVMAGHLELSLEGRSRRERLEAVSTTLCGSLQAGSIAFIEIHGCNWLVDNEPTALHWVVMDFWRRLIADLEIVARQRPGSVTLLAALFVDDQLPEGALSPEHCCSLADVHRDRCLEIELRNWTADEVGDWLARFGMTNHPDETIRSVRNLVMRISEGVPCLIEHELLKQLCPMTD